MASGLVGSALAFGLDPSEVDYSIPAKADKPTALVAILTATFMRDLSMNH